MGNGEDDDLRKLNYGIEADKGIHNYNHGKISKKSSQKKDSISAYDLFTTPHNFVSIKKTVKGPTGSKRRRLR